MDLDARQQTDRAPGIPLPGGALLFRIPERETSGGSGSRKLTVINQKNL